MSIEGWSTRGNRIPGSRYTACAVFALALTTAASAKAATPYDAGKMRITAVLGSSAYSDSRYVIAGAGFGYYVVDGLELSATGAYWIGASPTISELSPGVRYVLHFVPELQPYVGAFYRHRFIAGFNDQDSLGGQGGVLYSLGNGFIGGGAVYERLISRCDVDCDVLYPELVVALSF